MSDFFSEKLIPQLETNHIGKNIVYLEETDSTNALAKREKNYPCGTVFVAGKQTDGRGRSGRVWQSNDENALYMSILIKPDISPQKISSITLVFGLAVFNALRGYADIGIKWPNDIILDNKKLAGILCEMSGNEEKIDYVVCGVGVNVNNTSFHDEIKDIATSLRIQTGKGYEITEIAAEILNEFDILYAEFLNKGLDDILIKYKNNCITLQKDVKVIMNNTETDAYALDITSEGGLLVRIDKEEKVIVSGEASIRGIIGYA